MSLALIWCALSAGGGLGDGEITMTEAEIAAALDRAIVRQAWHRWWDEILRGPTYLGPGAVITIGYKDPFEASDVTTR
tara:strand:- start:308 stop:541 length:234 start_codon:yes stop_codon:yes gene_type:complete